MSALINLVIRDAMPGDPPVWPMWRQATTDRP